MERSLLPPPAWTRTYRTMTFDTREQAAGAVYDAYFDAQFIKWQELVQLRLAATSEQPGAFTTELIVVTIPNAYIVFQTLNGWLGAHVVTIRWRAPWERYLVQEARYAA